MHSFQVLILWALLMYCTGSRVLELSDKFSEVRKEGGNWLVMFYAPWCGHCKRLEPIWAHVAQALYRTNVRVGKIDCTKYTSLAYEFNVYGYPTIKFIKGQDDYIFRGDRTKQDIIDFALRMSGPVVQELTKPESLFQIKNSNQVFFMYLGPQAGMLWDTYYGIANKMQPHGFFYTIDTNLAKLHFETDELPSIFVYKESMHHFFRMETNIVDLNAEQLNETMFGWINEERFGTFPKITKGNMKEILQTRKYIVLAVVEENKLQQISQEMIEFREMVESVIRKKRDKFHKNFQFGWVGNPEIANSIVMTVLPLPYLLVLNSTTYHHHVPEDEPSQLTPDAIDLFLEQICNQSVPAYGGNSIPSTIYRIYFEARTSLGEMWRGNPVLTTVLFGLPLGFLSLIFYSICCSDILDAEDEEEDYNLHEKRE